MIKGIGPKMADRIVAHFDADTLRIIEEEPGRLIEVHGLGSRNGPRMIADAWEEQKAIKEVMVFLPGSASPPRSPCGSTRRTGTPHRRGEERAV